MQKIIDPQYRAGHVTSKILLVIHRFFIKKNPSKIS